jgi:hypothetical protein
MNATVHDVTFEKKVNGGQMETLKSREYRHGLLIPRQSPDCVPFFEKIS